MAVTWDKAMYDLAYDMGAEPDGHPNTRGEIRLHYHRYVLFPEMLRRAQFFVQQFSLTAASRVLVVGCGFGWTAEALSALGIPTIGTEISSYIQTNKSLTEDADIAEAIAKVGLTAVAGEGLGHFNRLRGDGVRTRATVMEEDNMNNASRNRVKNGLGGSITLCITEDVLTSLTDAECSSLRVAIEKYGVPMCHFVTEFANSNPPFNFNSKSLADWKLTFPNDTIIADGYTYRVA